MEQLPTSRADVALYITLALMKVRASIADRVSGALGIAGLFALQSAYELIFCGGGVFGFWEVTLILVVPSVLLLLVAGTRPALVSCAVLIPFILFANGAECAPYRGGGAAMGYVPAFLFGMPLSFIAGVAAAIRMFLQRRRLANAG